MNAANPWLMSSRRQAAVENKPAEQETAPVVQFAARPRPRGVVDQALPTQTHPAKAGLWLVGTHGGSGASTLARLSGALDAGGAWPDTGGTAACALVCRTHMAGVKAAQEALRQWAGGGAPAGVELVGLVLVADAPKKPPVPVRELVEVLAGPLHQVIEVGWVEPWRAEAEPAESSAPRGVRTAIRDLAALAGSLAAQAAI